MPRDSPYSISIPSTDILSWLFPPTTPPSTKPLWISTADTSRTLSPAQLLTYTKRLALGLSRLSLPQDSVLLVYSTNHILVPAAYLAGGCGACIFSGANPAYGPAELAFQMEDTRAAVVLVDPRLLGNALQAVGKVGIARERVFLFDEVECEEREGVRDWRALLAGEEEVQGWRWKALGKEEARTRTAALNYSSGTTGLPKGVKISHQNVIANVHQSLYMRALETESPSSLRRADYPSHERWLSFLPLYHAYGQMWSIVCAAKTLTTTYFMRTYDFDTFLKNLARFKITHIQTAPPVVVQLGKRPETSRHDLSHLRNILCGAAPLSAELQNEVAARINPDLKIVQTYGMTELTCSVCWVPGLMRDTSGSIGLPGPNCSIKLVDDDGNEVNDDETPGEVCVKGPNVCLGYWRNEQATRDTFDADGFLRTGDVAISRKGWYWIVDRKKELIKVKGFQVAPAELEAALLEHEDVSDAAVVGLPPARDGDGEERPRAYVCLKEGASQGASQDASQGASQSREEEIVRWLEGRVARHKRLTGGVAIIDEVPKSPSGKIQRKILREWAKRDVEAEQSSSRAKL